MGTIVEATIPVNEFALKDTFETLPESEFEIRRTVADGGDGGTFVWASADDRERLAAALEDDATTKDVSRVAELAEAGLYRIEWASPIRFLFSLLAGSDGSILRTRGTTTGWDLRFLFLEHSGASAMHDVCQAYGLEISISRVVNLDEANPDTQGALAEQHLTDKQRETLRLAYETGYYAIPRETSLKELAERQNISHQSLSERLRRGHEALIECQRNTFLQLDPTPPATTNRQSPSVRTFQ
jgi:predicted DNA binding protein